MEQPSLSVSLGLARLPGLCRMLEALTHPYVPPQLLERSLGPWGGPGFWCLSLSAGTSFPTIVTHCKI